MADPDLQIRVGPGHPDPEIRVGGRFPKKIFPALRASFWSKNKGGAGPPGPLPWIHHCAGSPLNRTEIYPDNSNSPLTRTVFRFPSKFELPGFYCSLKMRRLKPVLSQLFKLTDMNVLILNSVQYFIVCKK